MVVEISGSVDDSSIVTNLLEKFRLISSLTEETELLNQKPAYPVYPVYLVELEDSLPSLYSGTRHLY